MHARGRSPRRAFRRLLLAAAVVATAVPLAAGPAAADPPSTEGRIVFMGDNRLMTMAGDGTDVVPLTTGLGKDPTWSPDGTRVAFARSNDIWTVNADGTGERRLTTEPTLDTSPTWIWDPRDGSVVYDDGGSALTGGSIVVHG